MSLWLIMAVMYLLDNIHYLMNEYIYVFHLYIYISTEYIYIEYIRLYVLSIDHIICICIYMMQKTKRLSNSYKTVSL